MYETTTLVGSLKKIEQNKIMHKDSKTKNRNPRFKSYYGSYIKPTYRIS
jgi:hypothetical protein